MGLILNLRGTSGSGKTEFVRRVLARYGGLDAAEPLYRAGRARPIAYRLAHPGGARDLAVLGQYGGTCGGCDTIPLSDGGIPGALALAAGFAGEGCDVLMEGLALSAEHRLTAALAATRPLHVLRLATPHARCVQQLLRRRRSGAALRAHLEQKVAREALGVDAACAALSGVTPVEALEFDDAMARARALLGLEEPALVVPVQAVPLELVGVSFAG